MSKIKDGGSAFPHPEYNDDGTVYRQHEGMTLRDYFAGQALAGVVERMNPQGDFPTEDISARMAYRYADAMLRAREASHDEG